METIVIQHDVWFQILKATGFITELIEVRLEVVLQNLRIFDYIENE